MNRLPVDVAYEIAVLLHNSGVGNPHPHTVDYAVKLHRIESLRDTLNWYRIIAGVQA